MKRVALLLALTLFVHSEPIANATIYTEEQCLASAIYYEARGESKEGKRAVLDVIENRMAAQGKSACQIILQKRQFSWTFFRPIRKYDEKMEKMLTEIKDAPRILVDERYKYFFSRFIRPPWSYRMDCRRIGNHLFCREK